MSLRDNLRLPATCPRVPLLPVVQPLRPSCMASVSQSLGHLSQAMPTICFCLLISSG